MRRSALLVVSAATAISALAVVPAHAFSVPNDPGYGRQWGMTIVGAPQAWAAGAVGTGVKIGIVDTGIDLLHEDLQNKVVASTSCIGAAGDMTKCHGSAQDDNGHGTHVSGIAAASTNNAKGVAGVAPGAQLVVARVLAGGSDGSASGSTNDIIAGMEWVMAHGAQVINLSLGDSTPISSVLGSDLAGEINTAWTQKHVVVVVAAGNNGFLTSSEYKNTNAVVVTATDRNDGVASYASPDGSLVGSAKWGMAAPGGAGTDTAQSCTSAPNDVLSTFGYVNNPADANKTAHGYECLAGTSMAAPHVAGAAAVLLGLGVPYNQVPDRLVNTAKNINNSAAGHGRLDLAKAIAGLTPTSASTNPAGTTATGTGASVPRVSGSPARTGVVAPRVAPPTGVAAADPSTTVAPTTAGPTTAAEPSAPSRERAAPPFDRAAHHGSSTSRWWAGLAAVALAVALSATVTVLWRRRPRVSAR
jgi:subtilisin family serine protease